MSARREEILALIRGFIAQHAGRSLDDVPQFPDDYDLFENGDLDSFGFVELLSLLSDRTGHFLDLSDVDPAELSVVGTLVRHYDGGASG